MITARHAMALDTSVINKNVTLCNGVIIFYFDLAGMTTGCVPATGGALAQVRTASTGTGTCCQHRTGMYCQQWLWYVLPALAQVCTARHNYALAQVCSAITGTGMYCQHW